MVTRWPALFLLMSGLIFVPQQDLPGRLMLEAVKRHRLSAEIITARIVILESNGERKERRSQTWLQTTPEGTWTARVDYLAPSQLEGLSFHLERKAGDLFPHDSIHLPSIDQTIPVTSDSLEFVPASRLVGLSWMLLDPNQYRYRVLGRDQIDGFDCQIIVASPAQEGAIAGFSESRRLIWLREDLLFPKRIRIYDRTDRLRQTVYFDQLERLVGEIWRARRIVTLDHASGRQTETIIEKDQSLDSIDDKIFQTTSERRLPRALR